MQLTPKQERFCQLYLETGNASEAYRQSYSAERMKAETVHRTAKELLDNPKIATRLEILMSEHRKRHNVTVDSLTIELDEALDLAKGTKNPSAAVAAITAKAKLHGLLIEKRQLETIGKSDDPSQLSDRELERIIARKDKALTTQH